MGSIRKGPASKGLGKCLWSVAAIPRVDALRKLVVELQFPEDYPRLLENRPAGSLEFTETERSHGARTALPQMWYASDTRGAVLRLRDSGVLPLKISIHLRHNALPDHSSPGRASRFCCSTDCAGHEPSPISARGGIANFILEGV